LKMKRKRRKAKTNHIIYSVIIASGKVEKAYKHIYSGTLRDAVAYCNLIDLHCRPGEEGMMSVSKIEKSFETYDEAYNALKEEVRKWIVSYDNPELVGGDDHAAD